MGSSVVVYLVELFAVDSLSVTPTRSRGRVAETRSGRGPGFGFDVSLCDVTQPET
jgi:hypothetical protein